MEFNPRVLSIASYPSSQLAARKKKLADEGKKLFDFGTGDPVEPTPPFIREALIESVPVISQYPSVRGQPTLRQAVKGYVERRFGVSLDADRQILPCTGSKESIYNLTFLMVGPDSTKDTVIGPVPGYFVMERSAAVCGARYYRYELSPENKFLLDLETLPKELLDRTAIAWINYPHNPTGATCDRAYLAKQVEIAKRHDILLCSDECYVDLYYDGEPPPSVLEVTTEGVLAFHSCSKRSGMTAYRTGFIAGDSTVLGHYASFRETIGVATPIYTQAAATAAWKDDAHATERNTIFKQKRALFTTFFDRRGFEYVKSDATFYFWIRSPNGMQGAEYANALLEHGIVVSPGEFFGGSTRDWFRIALVPSIAECEEAISLWPEV